MKQKEGSYPFKTIEDHELSHDVHWEQHKVLHFQCQKSL